MVAAPFPNAGKAPSLLLKGSFFLNAGNAHASYAGRPPSLMLKGSFLC